MEGVMMPPRAQGAWGCQANGGSKTILKGETS